MKTRTFDPAESVVWLGAFSDADRKEIEYLRVSQAKAIIAGNARAYAELCTDDIQLLIPGRDLVSGKTAFLQVEEALFSRATFASFLKQPLRVDGDGNLAIEVGRQQVRMQQSEPSGGVFSSQQKYVHIFRRTSEGWRFSLLMSNPSE